MGWETIKGRRYFYETTYVEGKRIRRCWGRGPQAESAATRVEQQQRARRADLAQVQSFRDRDRRIDKQVKKFNTTINHTIQTHQNQVGYHYCRRQWRKRKIQMSQKTALTKLKTECQNVSPIDDSTSDMPEHLSYEIRRIALEALRGIPTPKADEPHVTLICDIEETIVNVEEKVAQLRRDLQYEESNTFNRLVIEQLLTAWVQWFVAGWLLEAELPVNRSLRQNQYFTHRYQQCQTRLTKAIDQLAKIRQIPASKLQLDSLEEQATRIKRDKERQARWDAEFIQHN